MVRLVAIAVSPNAGSNSCFNSTMVRLVEVYGPQLPVNYQFQFHYGTIGSHGLSFESAGIIGFQFHYGTIGS